MKRVGHVLLGIVFFVGFVSATAHSRTLRVNESGSPGSSEAMAMELFKKIVEEQTNGDLKIRIYLQDQLGKPQTSLENLMSGTLDLYYGALSYYEKMSPDEMRILTLLYFFKDVEHLRKYLKGPVFGEALEKIRDQGIRFLSTEWNGVRGPYRVFICTKPIMKPEDLKGIKMRIWPNEAVKRCWSHMGAVPVVLPWTETYLAIKQKMIHAVTSPLDLVRTTRFTEVAPYVTELKQFSKVLPLTISEQVWQTLSTAQQKILVGAANEADKLYAKINYERAEKDIQSMMHENSSVFIRVNTEPFEKKMVPFYKQLVKEGYIKKEIFESVQKIR